MASASPLEVPLPPSTGSSPSRSPNKQPATFRSRRPRTRRNGGASSGSSRASPNPTAPLGPRGWEDWPEIIVRIEQVPLDITTVDLFKWFSPEGEIVWLDMFQTAHSGAGTMSAKIRFEPPPDRAFWDRGLFSVTHPNHPEGIKLMVRASMEPPRGWIANPNIPDRSYPIKIKLPVKSLEFGSMVGPKAMKTMKTFEAQDDDNNLKLEVDARNRKISVFFPVATRTATSQGIRRYKFVADTAVIKTAYQCPGEDVALIIPLPFPPQYFWKRDNVISTVLPDQQSWNSRDAWPRATDIAEKVDVQMRHPVAVHNDIVDAGYMEIGRWTTFRIVLDAKSESSQLAIQQIHMALEDCNVRVDVCDDFQVSPADQATMWTYLDHAAAAADGSALALLNSSPVIHLPFEVRYQLEVCVSRGILSDLNVPPEFLHQLAALDPTRARLYLEFLVEQGEPLYDPMSLFTNPEAASYFPYTRIPHYCALVRKATITPTTIHFSSPAVETSNRVIRKYSQVQDRFLRIQFVEEYERGRINSRNAGDDEVWKRVLRTLYQGIKIGERRYEFLAFGSSQLRQNGAYFFCPTDHISCDSIRNWMGHFDHIKIIAKYSARLGQCLSTTREIRGIYVPKIITIDDIEKNGYCFTDGVGMISEFLAKLIIEEMTLDIFDEPGVFQFRMGGCKGVLAVWPQAKGMEVCVRASQEKFKAEFNGLEIIRCAKFASATLNRQTITILECLGVPIRSFRNLIDQQLHSYELSKTDTQMAIELLTRFVDDNQTTLILAEILRAGFKTEELQEPFVVNVVNLWRTWSLKLLKEKARIEIEKSAFVLGIVDETKTLRGHSFATEGSKDKDVNKLPQIFLQITDPKQYGKTNIVKGVCVVGRNPSLHPGDIRVVQAVDVPALHHLKDVVVFPSKGDRPVANMLSGGDLDGDDFFVIWEPSLRPTEWNHPPMNYNAPPPEQLDRDVNVDDLRNFFVNYMKNDVLPLIATAHLGVADEQGPKSPLCLKLANLHSKAVDYPKTGEPAEWSIKFQPRRWPHFMEKKSTYTSRKALGAVFNRVASQSIQFLPDWEHAFDQRILTRFQLTNELLEAARKVKSQYDTAVRRILSQQDLSTEFELWTSFAMSAPAVGSAFKRQEDLGFEYDALKQRFRDLCYEAAGGNAAEKLDPFVAAMYKVTEEEVKIALHQHHREWAEDTETTGESPQLDQKSMPLISFPWIFHWVMIRIALGDNYNPKKSRMAVARRGGNVVPRFAPATSGSGTKSLAAQVEEVSTKLPDGSLVHRGQPLTLFHANERDAYEPVGEEGHSSDGETGPEKVEEKREGEAGAASDGDTDDACAMDRLAQLVDFGDD